MASPFPLKLVLRAMTTRVRLSRARGWRLPVNTVSVAYPTKWANPFRPDRRDAAANAGAVARYKAHLDVHPELVEAAQVELAGKDLACWCPPILPCHADILLAIAAGAPAVLVDPADRR